MYVIMKGAFLNVQFSRREVEPVVKEFIFSILKQIIIQMLAPEPSGKNLEKFTPVTVYNST